MTKLVAGFEAMRGGREGVHRQDLWFIRFYPLAVAPGTYVETSQVLPAGAEITEVFLHVSPVDRTTGINVIVNLFICEDVVPPFAIINELPPIFDWGRGVNRNLITLQGWEFQNTWRLCKRISEANQRVGYAVRANSPTGDRWMVGIRCLLP